MFKYKDQVVPAFYEMKDYVPEIDRRVLRNVNRECLHFSEKSRPHFEKIMHYFSEVTFERMGVLRGEYMLCGQILFRRDGLNIKANVVWGDRWSDANTSNDFCALPAFIEVKNDALKQWDQLPTLQSPIILSQFYAYSYFHWSLEIVTKNRFFAGHPDSLMVVPSSHLTQLFQTDLLTRTAPGRQFIVPQTHVTKVRDPIVSHETMSENSVRWLREKMNISVKTGGNRRVYFRRTPGTGRERTGGGICETPEFMAFLTEFNFEIIDFSDANRTIEEQVRLLDNVSVILAPHGAALTNITYLNPSLSIIEIVSPKTPRAMFLHIASILKFQYYGIFSSALDANDNIMVDMDELRDIMKECLA